MGSGSVRAFALRTLPSNKVLNTCCRKVEMQSTVTSAKIRPASVFNQIGRASRMPKGSGLEL